MAMDEKGRIYRQRKPHLSLRAVRLADQAVRQSRRPARSDARRQGLQTHAGGRRFRRSGHGHRHQGRQALADRVQLSSTSTTCSKRRRTPKDGIAINKKTILIDKNKAWNPFGMFVLEWGLDGKLYMSVGDHGIDIQGPDGKITGRRNSGIIMRMNPDGTKMERLTHGFRVPYSFEYDPFGQLWLLSNGEGNPEPLRPHSRGRRLSLLQPAAASTTTGWPGSQSAGAAGVRAARRGQHPAHALLRGRFPRGISGQPVPGQLGRPTASRAPIAASSASCRMSTTTSCKKEPLLSLHRSALPAEPHSARSGRQPADRRLVWPG